MVALQQKSESIDWQLAYFARYSDLHFTPDELGDLVFNGVASNVQRQSFVNGVQGDGSYKVNDTHTLRAGFFVSGEQTDVSNASAVMPDVGDIPVNVSESTSKLGWLLGGYLQDEWRLTRALTLNFGIRFDQMYQFVDANQWSPRASLVYKPFDGTTLHAGYARYFTPPSQVLAGPTNVAAFDNTSQASQTCGGQSPDVQPPCGLVLPERSHYFDVGIVQRIVPGLEMGVDGYYKIARDLLDDGQFGEALVLDGFNYAKAYNEGIEIKADYNVGNLRAYWNIAIAQQKGTNIASNQYLIDPDDLAYIANHYIFTDHSQTVTASAGISYLLWQKTRLSADMIYGSGLRTDSPDGVPNGSHVRATLKSISGCRTNFRTAWKSPPPSASTLSTCSTRCLRSATARASASLHRSTARGANSWSGYRRSSDGCEGRGLSRASVRCKNVSAQPTTAPKPPCRCGSGRAARASSGRPRTSPSWPTQAAGPRPAARRTR